MVPQSTKFCERQRSEMGRVRRQMKGSWRPAAVSRFLGDAVSTPPFQKGASVLGSERAGPVGARACRLHARGRLGKFP